MNAENNNWSRIRTASPKAKAIAKEIKQSIPIVMALNVEKVDYCNNGTLNALRSLETEIKKIPECGQTVKMLESVTEAISYLTLGQTFLADFKCEAE